jgi:hypothetical protein
LSIDDSLHPEVELGEGVKTEIFIRVNFIGIWDVDKHAIHDGILVIKPIEVGLEGKESSHQFMDHSVPNLSKSLKS